MTYKELDAIRLLQARNRLLRTVRAMLAGSGLDIRDREKGLVITNPADPDMGRIYINYLTGEVSWQRSLWTYFGHLKGYAQAPEADLVADAQTIIRTLCGGGSGDPL
ncbi:MAG TPA: hypothetical protein VGH27_12120 [Streptosporangiaceae bacterium]